jgi:polyhydroxyalkanoate synthesis regulator phasin
MAETHRTADAKNLKVPEFLREPLHAAQIRLEQLEDEAQRVIKDLMDRGRASRKDIEHMVQKWSKQDWTFPDVKNRLERLRDQGAERAAELRGRAESFRVETLERVFELQSRAVAFLGVASRTEVEELSKELDRLARRLDRSVKGKKTARKPSKGAEG